jgi:type II secretory pathway pseudopilin PulG
MKFRSLGGFSITEIAIVLIVAGLLIAGVLQAHTLIRQSKMKRTSKDFQSLMSALDIFYDRFGRLAGDMDGDGEFDSNDAVWVDLESEDLARRDLTSPYGASYTFQNGAFAGLTGNHFFSTIPPETGSYVDRSRDDGNADEGDIRCDDGYSGQDMVEVAYFLFSD